MKLSKLAILITAISTGVLGVATVTPLQDRSPSTDASPTSDFVPWPASASGHIETNAERLARGLTPSRPRALYGRRAKGLSRDTQAGFAKRLVGAPSAGRASPASTNTYRFKDCYSSGRGQCSHPFPYSADLQGGSGIAFYTFTYTTIQDLVNQCAAKQDQVANPGIQGFVVDTADHPYPFGGCGVSITSAQPEACSASNYAAYVLA